jgi:YggT family protein
MPYLLRATLFLIQTIFGFFIVMFLLRTMLIAVGASFYDPICQFVYKLTNPVITPLRRFVPRWRNIEFASLLVAWLLVALEFLLLYSLFSPEVPWLAWLPRAFVETLDWVILIELGAIFVYCLLSFFPSLRYDDNYRLLDRFVAPVVRPFRRIAPPLGGLDFSCWFAGIALMLARILLIAPLMDLAGTLG